MQRSKQGSTLVEIIIATGVVALVLTSVVAVITTSVRNTAQSKAKALATKYAQEGMELFRRERNALGWESFVQTIQQDGSNVTYCLATIPATDAIFTALGNAACGSTQFVDARNIFKRQATAVVGSPQQVDVTVTVTWEEAGITRESRIVQAFRQI